MLVNGEDLTKYKKMSDRIFEVIHKYCPQIEKLGLDENFIDVTELVNLTIANSVEEELGLSPDTFIYKPVDNDELPQECDCGCVRLLNVGTQVATELRKALFEELNVTSCAGIAYNKLLAKLVGSQNKPNKQTVIFDSLVSSFISSLGSVRSLPGIGHKLAETLAELSVRTVQDLQNAPLELLRKKLDEKTVQKIKSWCVGVDHSHVKPTGKQKTLSLEDSTFGNPLKSVYEVETKFSLLLIRLCDAICEDGRVPTVLRVTVRRTNAIEDINQRESRQTPLPTNLFKQKSGAALQLSDEKTLPQLIHLAMQLFAKVMGDKKQDFAVTLLGVAFTKFAEIVAKGANAIDRFLVPREAQLAAEKEVKAGKRPSSTTIESPPPSKRPKPSPLLKWIEKSSSEVEPGNPKSLQAQVINAGANSKASESSPVPTIINPETSNSVLEVASSSSVNKEEAPREQSIPPNVDPEVFEALPDDVKQELIEQWRAKPKPSEVTSPKSSVEAKGTAKGKKSASNTLDRFFKPM